MIRFVLQNGNSGSSRKPELGKETGRPAGATAWVQVREDEVSKHSGEEEREVGPSPASLSEETQKHLGPQ